MEAVVDSDLGEWLAWLADAPMFVDAVQLAAFHDAVISPSYKTLRLEMSREWVEALEKKGSAKLKAGLPMWFPWPKLEAELAGEVKKSRETRTGDVVTLEPIDNPGRKLVELSLHYLSNLPHRIWYGSSREEWKVPTADEVQKTPKMLAFLDFPSGTKFVPMAGELDDGRVVTFYDPLVDALKTSGGTLPIRYPDRSSPKYDEDSQRYWEWFSKNWNPNKAIQVIENIIRDRGRPRWVDYRVPLISGVTMHLHVVGRGQTDTGVFAYNLVKRGSNHGLRVVASVKTEPDLNVLAIFEK